MTLARTPSHLPSCAMQLPRNIWHPHTGIILTNGAAVVFLLCLRGTGGSTVKVKVDGPATLTSLLFIGSLGQSHSQNRTSLFRRRPTEAKWREDGGNCFVSQCKNITATVFQLLSFSVCEARLWRFYAMLSATANGWYHSECVILEKQPPTAERGHSTIFVAAQFVIYPCCKSIDFRGKGMTRSVLPSIPNPAAD